MCSMKPDRQASWMSSNRALSVSCRWRFSRVEPLVEGVRAPACLDLIGDLFPTYWERPAFPDVLDGLRRRARCKCNNGHLFPFLVPAFCQQIRWFSFAADVCKLLPMRRLFSWWGCRWLAIWRWVVTCVRSFSFRRRMRCRVCELFRHGPWLGLPGVGRGSIRNNLVFCNPVDPIIVGDTLMSRDPWDLFSHSMLS